MLRFKQVFTSLASLAAWVSLGWMVANPIAHAALCEESFNLQEAKQYLYTTQTVNDLGSPSVTTLKTDLSDMKILFDSTAYQIMVGFDGACETFTQKEVRFKARNKREVGLKNAKVNDLYIRMYDSNTVLNGKTYAYWFGFSLRPDTLIYAVGKGKGPTDNFSVWYAVALFADSTRDGTSGLWSGAYSYQTQVSGPSDSLTLAQSVMKNWKDVTFGENRKGHFQVQMISVAYDAKPTALRPSKPKQSAAPGLVAYQNGNQVRLTLRQPSENWASLELYDMFGRQVAQLHPTGNDYLWNGFSLQGNAAPGGVYFAQSQGKVMGKFFFNR